MVIRAVLIDLSGTLHIENEAISGAVEALKRLCAVNYFQVRFVTNTTKESQNALHQRLQRLGFPIKATHIHSSLVATRHVIERERLRPLYLLADEAMQDFKDLPPPATGMQLEQQLNAVVVGLAPNHFHYERLNEAFRLLLHNPDAQLIAAHAGRYYKSGDGQLSLGPGCFIKGLEYATGKQSRVVGKPTKAFFESALQQCHQLEEPHEIDVAEALMVGDDAIDDIKGALDAGIGAAILVQTGKYRPGDEHKVPVDNQQRFHCVRDFSAAVDLILTNYHNN